MIRPDIGPASSMGFPVEPMRRRTTSSMTVAAAVLGAAAFAAVVLFAAAADVQPAARAGLGVALVVLVAAAVAIAMRLGQRARATEQDLQALRERWTDFLAVSADWYWEMDADLRFTYFSDNVEAVTGSPIKAVIGRRREDIADASMRSSESWRRHLDDLAARRPFRGFGYTHRRPDGETRHFQISGDPVFAGDGRFLGYRGSGRDVTDLMRAESRVIDAIEAMQAGFILWDAHDRLVMCNSAISRVDSDDFVVGRSFADVMRRRVAGGKVASARGREEAYLADVLASHRAADGRPVETELASGGWVEIIERRTRDGGVVSIRRDITEIKRREAELLRAESRLTDAIESIQDGFILWDQDERMIVANSAVTRIDPAAAGLLVPGITFEDFLRARLKRGPITQSAPDEEAYVRKSLEEFRSSRSGSKVVQQADGRWVRVSKSLTREGGIVSLRQDITAEKQREAELLRAESRLTDAIEALTDSFVLWDAEDRLVMWNSASERIEPESGRNLKVGMRYEEYMRARIGEGRFLDAIGREEQYLAERLAQRRAGTGQAILQRLSSGMWLRLSEHRTRDGGVVVIRSDVTETKMREAELLRAKNQAEAANVAKSQFLATMSHELRTPLNAIIGFSDMLISQVYGPLGSPRYAGYAQDIHASGQHLLALITDILDMSRIEAGRYEFRPETVALADLVEESLRMVRGRAEEHGIHLSPVIEPGISTLWADRRALKQILLNLLSNAVKFTRDGGRVTLSAMTNPDGGIAIAVADSGVGIDPARLARIFEPFQHVNASVARGAEGTGLGLSICKRLADLHGAAISIASTVGRGTTVTVNFPPSREGKANAA
ncbi:MAG: PAS-domain containing protein [Alphaproteobacteria bacterium]|nr:PAS-domain containing protein [Alphaproteobacteria bacterium]